MAKSKNKFYAIKVGKETGVFSESWDVVSKLVQGYQGASYKGFPTRKEAEDWYNDVKRELISAEEVDENTLVAFVDGSSSATIDEYGCGVVLIFPNKDIEEISFSGNHEDAKELKNVAGEMSSTMRAMAEARKRGYKKLIIYHDYLGISKWLTREWRAKNQITKTYVEWYEKVIKDDLEVHFKWVKGHSGNEYNELADILAKKAIGIS